MCSEMIRSKRPACHFPLTTHFGSDFGERLCGLAFDLLSRHILEGFAHFLNDSEVAITLSL